MSYWNSERREWRRGNISRVADDERYESLGTEAHSLLTKMNRYKPIPKYVSLTLQNAKTKEFKSCKEKKQNLQNNDSYTKNNVLSTNNGR